MPKYNNPRKTWRYADEFKIRAVEIKPDGLIMCWPGKAFELVIMHNMFSLE